LTNIAIKIGVGLWSPVLRYFRLLGAAIQRFNAHNSITLAGNMAFLGMLSFFPFLIFLVALSGFLGQTEVGQEAINLFLQNLPSEVVAIIHPPIKGIIRNTGGEILTISILFSLFSASSGVEAARTAITRAYGDRYTAPMWRRHLESLLVVVLAAILAIASMGLLVAGPPFIAAFEQFFSIPHDVRSTLNLAQYGVGPFVLFTALWVLYMALSPHKHFRKLFYAPGALLAVAVWLATGVGFSTYLKYAPNLDLAYGSLAGVLIAQIFFFVVSIGFILGAELNACYSRSHAQEKKDGDA